MYQKLMQPEIIESLESFKIWLNQEIAKLNNNINNNNNNTINEYEYELPRIQKFAILANRGERTFIIDFLNHCKLMSMVNAWNTVSKIDIFFQQMAMMCNYDNLVKLCQIIFGNFRSIENVLFQQTFFGSNCNINNVDSIFDQIERLFNQSYFDKIIYNVLYLLKTRENDALSKLQTINFQWKSDSANIMKSKYFKSQFEYTLHYDDIKSPIIVQCRKKSQSISKQCSKEIKLLRENYNELDHDQFDGINFELSLKIATNAKL